MKINHEFLYWKIIDGMLKLSSFLYCYFNEEKRLLYEAFIFSMDLFSL